MPRITNIELPIHVETVCISRPLKISHIVCSLSTFCTRYTIARHISTMTYLISWCYCHVGHVWLCIYAADLAMEQNNQVKKLPLLVLFLRCALLSVAEPHIVHIGSLIHRYYNSFCKYSTSRVVHSHAPLMQHVIYSDTTNWYNLVYLILL